MPPKDPAAKPPRATWDAEETKALLNTLYDKRNARSGNGWKEVAWTAALTSVNSLHPNDAEKQKNVKQCQSRLKTVVDIFKQYIKVQGYSGHGWDDDEQHATATEEHIKDYCETWGKEYEKCFRQPCPFYYELLQIYGKTMESSANGKAVVDFPRRKRSGGSKAKGKGKAKEKEKENTIILSDSEDTAAGPSNQRANDTPPPSPTRDGDQPAGPLEPKSPNAPAPRKRRRITARARAESEPAESDAEENTRDEERRRRGKNANGPAVRRNADAAALIATSLESVSQSMRQPIVTTTDTSHIATVARLLDEPNILPYDPRETLYTAVSLYFSRNPNDAHAFINATTMMRRKAIIANILEAVGHLVPYEYLQPPAVGFNLAPLP
ncbi:hypothetical protein C8F01DRAFT_1366734 [Mycena amicta]|nr:hypothetical protein C8F01DRAFT_1366734 [Mycena amicta]